MQNSNPILEKANSWLSEIYDEETRKKVAHLIQKDPAELTESFYRDLEFGTGGLRGIMGVGTNRMNIYTVGMATQGFSNYIKNQFSDAEEIKVAVAHDSRNNSRLFAETTSKIFSSNGFKVFLFEDLRPTPELSFAIRHFGCQGGVVITASHNPKEYNGFKAYWNDGGQLISPHDKNVIAEVQKITSVDSIDFNGIPENIITVGREFDAIYIDRIKALSLSPEVVKRNSAMKIVYTPIHGTGVELVPMALKAYGFENIISIPEQNIVSGDFPTVVSPNPEEPAAMSMALLKAKETNADLVMATDPDADRVGIGVRNSEGEFILLNGNQAATLLIYYLITKWKENGKLTGKEYIVKTIVTSEILKDIADSFNVICYDVLTGFKYIADIILKLEGKQQFIGGGEESYGYLAGDFVRDKDAVMSCVLLAETAAWAREQGKTMYELLIDIYMKHGLYKESLISIVKKGKEGSEQIQRMMDGFRQSPPKELGGSSVVCIKDYELQKSVDLITGKETPIDLPKSNVLQLFTDDGSKISIRPSGTEPKIKFYFGMKTSLASASEFNSRSKMLDEKIDKIVKEITG